MRSGRYIGAIEELQGKTAILLPGQHSSFEVRAQFDDMSLEIDGTRLGYNWHSFAKSDFELIPSGFEDE